MVRRAGRAALLVVLALGLAVAVASRGAHADSIIVTSAADAVSADGLCTLREAIENANVSGTHADCEAGGGADVISFSPAVRATGTITLGASLPVITTEITIDGAGAITIDADGQGRHFTVDGLLGDGDLTLLGLTLTGGEASGLPPADQGGAILNQSGLLALDNVAITGNSSGSHGAVHSIGGSVTVDNSEIVANTGSGLTGENAALVVEDSELGGNSGRGITSDAVSGGAASLTVMRSTALGNEGPGVEVRAFDPGSQSSASIAGLTATGNSDGFVANAFDGGSVQAGITNSSLSENGVSGLYSEAFTETGSASVEVTRSDIEGNGLLGIENRRATLVLDDVLIGGHDAAEAGATGITNDQGTVTISGSTISGNGAVIAGSAGGGIRTIAGVLTIGGTTFTANTARDGGAIASAGGMITISGGEISGNTAERTGGGIYADGGLVTLDGAILRGNSARDGGGIGAEGETFTEFVLTNAQVLANEAAQSGGGISLAGMNARLTVTGGEMSGNSTETGHGGAIFSAGVVTVSGAVLAGNSAGGSGGAITNNFVGSLEIEGSTLERNTAGINGGAIHNNGSTTVIASSTLSGNQAVRGGAISSVDGMLGATVTLRNTTVSGNSATFGAAVYGLSSDFTANNVTIANSAGPAITLQFGSGATLTNSIVAGSAGVNCSADATSTIAGTPNLSDDGTCGFGLVGDALLRPLEDNGGPTQTHAPRGGSPAIDAGDDLTCEPEDQAGTARPIGAACDLGAYEVPELGVYKSAGSLLAAPGSRVTFAIEVTNIGEEIADPVLTDLIDSEVGTLADVQAPDGWTCDETVACTAETLPGGGATLVFIISLDLAADLEAGTEIVNTATLEAGEVTAEDTVALTVQPVDLAITKEGPADVAAGALFGWTIEVSNVSEVTATGVEVTDELPPGVVFIGATVPAGWTCNGMESIVASGRLVCTAAELAPGATVSFILAAAAGARPATIVNTATVTSGSLDSDLTNNTASVTTDIAGGGAGPFIAWVPYASKAP